MKFLRKYWDRLRVTQGDTERDARSFWLQYAAGRYAGVKNASEIVRIAEQFYAWHMAARTPPAVVEEPSESYLTGSIPRDKWGRPL